MDKNQILSIVRAEPNNVTKVNTLFVTWIAMIHAQIYQVVSTQTEKQQMCVTRIVYQGAMQIQPCVGVVYLIIGANLKILIALRSIMTLVRLKQSATRYPAHQRSTLFVMITVALV
jgi:hypothetical protein